MQWTKFQKAAVVVGVGFIQLGLIRALIDEHNAKINVAKDYIRLADSYQTFWSRTKVLAPEVFDDDDVQNAFTKFIFESMTDSYTEIGDI